MGGSQGNYELVDNPKFDIEAGLQDGAFPEANSQDAAVFKNRFDEIASGGFSRHSSKRFKHILKRNKKLLLVLGVIIVIWLVGLGVYARGSTSSIFDYYKSKIGSTGGDSAPEVENNDHRPSQAIPTVEDPPQDLEYPDDYEQEGQDTDVPEQSEEKPKQEEEVEDDNLKSEDDESSEYKEEEQEEEQQQQQPSNTKRKVTMDDVRQGKFYVYDMYLKFLTPPTTLTDFKDEGLYYFQENDIFKAKKLSDPKYEVQLTNSLNFEFDSKSYKIQKFLPNFEMTYAIVETNSEKLFRHSSLSLYWLYNVKENSFAPLTGTVGEKSYYATWSPNYNYISIVKENNIYIKSLKDDNIKQITKDGSDLLLNGKTDWVYEEEVMANDAVLWWSPDETTFTFMKTDESEVPTYNLEYYVQTKEGGATKYPISKKISYPKPGFPNPKVSLFTYDLSKDTATEIVRSDSRLGEEFIVYEVFYVDNKELIIKESDRESNILNFRHYNVESKTSTITHNINASEQYNGWVEKLNSPIIIPPGSGRKSYGYVDTLVIEGYNHLVFFETASTSSPRVLTSGKWEVSNVKLAFDANKDLLYFSSNQQASIDRHIYSINLQTMVIERYLGEDGHGYYDSIFSPNAKYAAINYKGPETPVQKFYEVESKKELKTISNGGFLALSKSDYEIPTRTFHRVKVDENPDKSHVELNVIEILPINFDKTKKHPLLVHFYAGPGSQVVTSSYNVDFEDAIASSLDAVVLYIEPRGTAGQGWQFRSWANKKIGYWEPRDIVQVTKIWIDKGYIDKEKTALWGWSYGGFTTLKTLEYDAGDVFKYGMAVAPVTDWLFYDSIYTERYMDKPENNEEGYKISQISNVGNLGKTKRFLVMHGTADDNVHIQNTYSLLDLLDMGGIKNYDVHVFPDSEHSIYYHNANSIVYGKLTTWLKDAFDGDFDKLQNK